MKKIPWGKIQTYLLIATSIALIIVSVQLYKGKQESNRQYETFLNQFYFKLTSVIESLDAVLDEPLGEHDLAHNLEKIEQSLEDADLVLETGSRFVDWDIDYLPDSIFSNHPIIQFGEDDGLTAEEEQYLKNLKTDLTTIQAGLYSDETEQEDPDLTVSAFNYFIKGKGSDLKSGFLTEDKTIDIPFQFVDLEQVPNRIEKWIEQNASVEQRKVFLVNDTSYIVIVPDQEKDGSEQVSITNIVRKNGGITVNYGYKGERNDQERESSSVVAKLDIGAKRSFQFNTQVETEEHFVEIGGENNNKMTVSHTASDAEAEYVETEKLSKDGEIVNEYN